MSWRFIEVPGHHGSIVAEPYVRVLAGKLTDCIENSRSEFKKFVKEEHLNKTEKREFVKAVSF